MLQTRSEESILKETSERIDQLTKLKFDENKPLLAENSVGEEIKIKEELQDKVRAGEITPFQAVERHNNSKG